MISRRVPNVFLCHVTYVIENFDPEKSFFDLRQVRHSSFDVEIRTSISRIGLLESTTSRVWSKDCGLSRWFPYKLIAKRSPYWAKYRCEADLGK